MKIKGRTLPALMSFCQRNQELRNQESLTVAKKNEDEQRRKGESPGRVTNKKGQVSLAIPSSSLSGASRALFASLFIFFVPKEFIEPFISGRISSVLPRNASLIPETEVKRRARSGLCLQVHESTLNSSRQPNNVSTRRYFPSVEH